MADLSYEPGSLLIDHENGTCPMKHFIQTICNTLTRGESLVMATIVTAPDQARLSGARMLIHADGRIHGTIGGGLMEAEAQQIAANIFTRAEPQAQLLKFTGEAALPMHSPCGSGTTVLIEPITATPDNLDIFGKLLEALKKGMNCCLLTRIETDSKTLPPLHRQLVCAGKWLCGGLAIRPPEISAFLEKAATVTAPAIDTLVDRFYFLNPWIVPSTVYLFGAGHVAQEAAELAGKAGFRTVILDDREKFANPERFPTADKIVVLDSFENAFHGLEIDSESHVIIITRGHRHEKNLLRQALATPAGYIGVIGSIRKRDALFRELSAENLAVDDMLRIYCPIGINVLAESPLEIAVSIVAQLIQLRARKRTGKIQDSALRLGREVKTASPAAAG
ncbi:MAG: XdhC/CoxI family protein [Geobacter sp.]|nr:MAG: XdhC/CoxI family protein [Geobacter sp.]